MEIERKFLITTLPDLNHATHIKTIEQGYISTSPVIRIRQSNENYILTVKSKGLMAREEFELPLNMDEFLHLKGKLDYPTISKTRYLFPYESYTIELDIFHNQLDGLIMAEVEFKSVDDANAFIPPSWFGEDVTMDTFYHNSYLTTLKSYTPK